MSEPSPYAAVATPPPAAVSWWTPPEGEITDEIMAQVDPQDYISMRRLASRLKGGVGKNRETGSMVGAGYRDHFLVIVAPPDKQYKVGDDVVFPTNDSSTGKGLHRVVAVKPGYVYTKGISNKKGDGWTKVDDIYGKVVYPKPKM